MKRLLWVWMLLLLGCGAENNPPVLHFIEHRAVVVGEELVISLSAEDSDGDPITFGVFNAPEGSTLKQFNTTAIFRWAPLITDAAPGGKILEVIFQVSDLSGETTSQTVEITVYQEGGVPEFQTPSGFVINMAIESHVAFLVEVKDDDNVTVALTMSEGIEGASFQQVSGKIASFYWKPDATQLAESSYWSITIGADDGIHPVLLQEISIVLINVDTDICPGTLPMAQHIPPGDQMGTPSFPLNLYVSDGETQVSDVQLHWRTSSDPANSFQSVYIQHQGGELWSGEIQSTPLVGTQTEVYSYYFTFKDNDDITGSNCDHEARTPKSGEYVFVAYGPSAFGCLDDAYENNNSVLFPAALQEGTYSALRSCGDEDWYSFALSSGQSLTTELRYEPTHGQLTLSLYAAGGLSLKTGNGDGVQTLSYGPVTTDTELLIQVSSPGPAALTYALDLRTAVGGCDNDPLESNGDLLSATQLPAGEYKNLVICPGDEDWYAFPLSVGQHFEATLSFDQNDGDIDAVLYAPDGSTALVFGYSATSDEELQLDVPQTATYYLVVDGFIGASNTYDLKVLVNNQAELCFEDILAPNHTAETGVALPAGTWSGFTLCPGAPDYFVYTLNGSETLNAEATSEDESPPPIVRILGPDGTAVIGGNGVDNDVGWAEAVAFITGPYIIEVSLSLPSSVPYTIAFGATDPPGACLNDRFEPNNSFQTPQEIEKGVITRIKICPSDEDWFAVNLGAFQIVETWALFRHDLGDIDVAIYDTNGTLLGEATSSTDDEVLTVLTSTANTYYIQVRAKGSFNNAYDLVISTVD